MRRTAAVVVILVVAGVVGLIVHLADNRQPHRQHPVVDRRPELRRLIAEQEPASTQAVAEYQPALRDRLDDLGHPAAGLFRRVPGVVRVDGGWKVEKPTARIIHVRDWHFVPKELAAIDMVAAYGRPLTQSELDLLYEQHLLELELVQLEQMAVLRCLIKHHGLKRAFSEGFSPAELDAYREKVAALRSMETEEIPRLRSQLADTRNLVNGLSGERKQKAHAIEAEIVEMLDQHKSRMLELGAAGRLLVAGELEEVLPLEDAAALEESKPITPDGKLKLDPQKVEARHDAQVRSVMKAGPVAVIILGGAHDLTTSLRRLGYDQCEYLRVTTKRYREITE